MWNPFKKSGRKQVEEAIYGAALQYIQDQINEKISNDLINKNVDCVELYRILTTDGQILITKIYNQNDIIGFINHYEYDIKRINNDEEYEFKIYGKLYTLSEAYKDINKYVSVIINSKHFDNNILCFGEIGSLLFNDDGFDISLIIRVPFKEIYKKDEKTVDVKAKDGSFQNTYTVK